jgi:hypothetical protein
MSELLRRLQSSERISRSHCVNSNNPLSLSGSHRLGRLPHIPRAMYTILLSFSYIPTFLHSYIPTPLVITFHSSPPSMSHHSDESDSSGFVEVRHRESCSPPKRSRSRLTNSALGEESSNAAQKETSDLDTPSTQDGDKSINPATATLCAITEFSPEFLALCKQYYEECLTSAQIDASQVVPASFHEPPFTSADQQFTPANDRATLYDKVHSVLATSIGGQLVFLNSGTRQGIIYSQTAIATDGIERQLFYRGRSKLAEGEKPPTFSEAPWVVSIPPMPTIKTGSCVSCRSAL